MKDNLPELRDIHLPEGVSAFPPAIGWYIVLCLIIIAFVLYICIKKAIKHSKKRYATNLINKASQDNPIIFATTCSEVLRRICIYKHKKAQSKKGSEWESFLTQNCSYKLDNKSMNLLINAPYLSPENKDYNLQNTAQIKAFCIKFIGENL